MGESCHRNRKHTTAIVATLREFQGSLSHFLGSPHEFSEIRKQNAEVELEASLFPMTREHCLAWAAWCCHPSLADAQSRFG